MKHLRIASLLIGVIFLSACSYGYNILIVNESDKAIEVRYKTNTNDPFDDPMVKSLDDWNMRKSIKRFWTEETRWQNLQGNQFETILNERIIKVLPRQVVQIERGIYNPRRGDREGLTPNSRTQVSIF